MAAEVRHHFDKRDGVGSVVLAAAGGVSAGGQDVTMLYVNPDGHGVTIDGRFVYYSHLHRYGLERRDLRYALLGILFRSLRRLSVSEISNQLRAEYRVPPNVSNRSIADALAHECARGRARRWGWGIYGPGVVSDSTRRRIQQRVRMLDCCRLRLPRAEHLMHARETGAP